MGLKTGIYSIDQQGIYISRDGSIWDYRLIEGKPEEDTFLIANELNTNSVIKTIIKSESGAYRIDKVIEDKLMILSAVRAMEN
ncbi:hypothetical protein [Lysinibacillus xylanilyticus]|uniref:hypothetical protein n=1 Tax=Lysinibacillus xylanilyticus TaxID=582475 RepID=UPI003D0697C7